VGKRPEGNARSRPCENVQVKRQVKAEHMNGPREHPGQLGTAAGLGPGSRTLQTITSREILSSCQRACAAF
jgi:hypothetical protein